ncbi:aquaporin-like protein [Xylariomycetidae sp. FL0641]|nr:aquaporin-like protein [Xylariomycetidae sp. FL0641]
MTDNEAPGNPETSGQNGGQQNGGQQNGGHPSPASPADSGDSRTISGISNATQEEVNLGDAVQRINLSHHSSRPTDLTVRTRNGIEATDWEEKARAAAAQSEDGGPANKAQTSDWVDDDYRQANPWYGKKETKPLFSLGRPLPRTVRWNKPQPGQDHAALGSVRSRDPEDLEKQPTAESQRPRYTADGTAHGDRVNDLGQPVFDYMPTRTNTRGSQASRSTGGGGGGGDEPSFGIDSEPLGQQESDEVEQGGADPNQLRNWWARIRAKHPEPLAEFLATAMAVFMGLAGTLSVNLSATQANQYGTYETSCWAWGFAWMFGIYLGGGVSGAHMNPAISFSLSLFRGFPWKQCGIYVLAQFLGSIAAGGLAYACYCDTIHHIDPDMSNTAKTFFSSPQTWVSPGNAVVNQMVGSAIMMIAVFALGDDQNNPPGAGMHAFVLGLLVTSLKFTLGFNVGSALNPASDFGPRIIAYAVGYHTDKVWETGWWIYGPWAATLAGSVIGCSIYDSFIFVGTESPINYRIPERYRQRAKKILDIKTDQ